MEFVYTMLVLGVYLSTTDISAIGIGDMDGTLHRIVVSGNFTDWAEARNHCMALGGDLSVPKPNSTQLTDAMDPGMNQVWIGGRAVRLWIRDNSAFYFGKWLGCVNRSILGANFRTTTGLSECLESCSLFKYCYVTNKFRCNCSNEYYKESNQQCTDPYDWAPEGMDNDNKIHKFNMRSKDNTVDTRNWWTVRVRRQGQAGSYSYTFNMERRARQEKYPPLCQSVNSRSSGKSIVYGGSFLWKIELQHNRASAQQICQRENGTLAKLDWESPMFNEKLYNLHNGRLWMGLDRIRWSFIDGNLVMSTWPAFQSNSRTGCLVWRRSVGLKNVSCKQDHPIPTACTVPYRISTEVLTTTTGLTSESEANQSMSSEAPQTENTTQATLPQYSTGVSVGVGVTVALLAAVGVTLIVVWRIRTKTDKSSDSLHHNLPSSGNNALTSSNLGGGRPTCQPEDNQPHRYESVKIQPNVPPGEHYSQLTSESVVTDTHNSFQPEKDVCGDPYDKLNVQRAYGPTNDRAEPPPAYSVVSLDADSGYVNSSDISLTSPYGHLSTRGIPGERNNMDYDELKIRNMRSSCEVDTSSLYNHIPAKGN